jgi:uncharacterized protein with GYD domain
MAKFLVLFNFTEQGAKNISETTSRAEAFHKMAQKVGASVQAQYWTVGAYDGALVLDAPDEQSAAALLTKLGTLGNVRTQTLRAFERAEMEAILAKAR